jgi:hypothetical protein
VSTTAERGLAFMWINEKPDSPHNGDFLDLTELTIKFDPFLANHTNTVELVDLSKTVCDDVYQFNSKEVRQSDFDLGGGERVFLLTLYQIFLMLIS